MVINAFVGFDEADNPVLVEVIELVDPRPCGQGDSVVHVRVRSENDKLFIPLDDLLELLHQLWAAFRAVILNEHAPILQIVHLELLGDRARVNPPPGQAPDMGTRGWGIRVVGHMRLSKASNVGVAEAWNGVARQVATRLVGEPSDHSRDHNSRPPTRAPASGGVEA